MFVAEWNHGGPHSIQPRPAMISHCVNPDCNLPFHYSRGGRLYRFDAAGQSFGVETVSNAICSQQPSGTAVFFWLCKRCSPGLSVTFDGQHASVAPVPSTSRSRSPVVALGEPTSGDAVAADAPATKANPES